jgi:hypothetical protein
MASFRFHLAMDTLAIRLAVPLAGPALDFNQQVSAPCRAHKKNDANLAIRVVKAGLLIAKSYLVGTVAMVCRMRLAILYGSP